MKRNMLSARKVQTAGIGWHADGGGLYLQVTPGGRSWVFRFKLDGHERYMGLGSTENVTLAEAREKAAAARKLRSEGVDPIEHRKAQRTAMQLSATKAMTFKQCADAFIASHEAGWNSAKHRQQWVNTLAQHVHPVLGALPVNAIDTAMVMKAIGPLWTTIPETASRVRGRIEAILDWARVSGYRTGENCARWRGHLDHLLPASSKVRKTEHLAALPYVEVGAFMAKLRAQDGPAARCLEFIVLTAARLGEALNATWDEIDIANHTWTIPAKKMKGGREHRVPLSNAALAALPRNTRPEGLVFPGYRASRPLGPITLLQLAKKLGSPNVHGFRSSFRDWAAEATNFPNHVVEMALAHKVGNKVEAAYRRGDLFTKRAKLMTTWGQFCGETPISSAVIPFQKFS
jgi:integrase